MATIEDLKKKIAQLDITLSGKENQIRYLKDQLTKAEVMMGKAHKELKQHDEIMEAVKLALDRANPKFKNECESLKWLDKLLNGDFNGYSNYYN